MGLRDYLAKRTQEKIKADKEAERIAEQKAIDKKRYEDELKYQESLDKQPSRFEADLSKLTKKLTTSVKKGISVATPIVKKAAKSVKPALKEAYAKGAPIVKRMGKGAAQSEYYDDEPQRNSGSHERESQSSHVNVKKDAIAALINLGYSKNASANAVYSIRGNLSAQALVKAAIAKLSKGEVSEERYVPPQPQRESRSASPRSPPFRDDIAPAPRVSRDYNSNTLLPERPRKQVRNEDFFVSGFPPRSPEEEGSPRKPLRQPKGAEKYFVDTSKKPSPRKQVGKLQKKPQKKEKRNRGFGLGF